MVRRHTRFAHTLAAMLSAVVLGLSAMASAGAAGPPQTTLPVSGALVPPTIKSAAPSSGFVVDPAALLGPSWTSPTPPLGFRPAPLSAAAVVKASFFGPGVTVKTYTVTGATPLAIVRSVQARGPSSAWTGARAEAVTQSITTYHFGFDAELAPGDSGAMVGVCQIRHDASPAITQAYTVLLPRWTRPRGASNETIRWWADELVRVATHERTHVQDGIKATRAANIVLASSTCANAETRLNAVWLNLQRQGCEFDMHEYGKAAGLTLKSCTSQ